MAEIIIVIVIVAVAIVWVGRSFYRSAITRMKGCACEEECPLSDMCDPTSGDCVTNLRDTSRQRSP